MITSAMIITGLLGLLMATYPPLWVMLCIQVAFAITTILMLWSVSIKARCWAIIVSKGKLWAGWKGCAASV